MALIQYMRADGVQVFRGTADLTEGERFAVECTLDDDAEVHFYDILPTSEAERAGWAVRPDHTWCRRTWPVKVASLRRVVAHERRMR
ncbi:MAG: hypothetical protein EKK55_01860 [Rhodocyclaceae bacterium]|nr:MAG: hypothetical protein EKK55_01860 [Rhodocyclaceae bacterium]